MKAWIAILRCVRSLMRGPPILAPHSGRSMAMAGVVEFKLLQLRPRGRASGGYARAVKIERLP